MTLFADDTDLRGRAYCAARSGEADRWLVGLFNDAVQGEANKVALVAVGGYGRGLLWPQSDLDLVLFHNKRKDIAEIAERLWYPIWDKNLKLGHAVLTPKEAAKLASAELERATAFSVLRLVAGDPQVLEASADAIDKVRSKRAKSQMQELDRVVVERHNTSGDVAFHLEPDLKEGRGGLRDLDSMRWAESMEPGFARDLLEGLDQAADVLIGARVELHRLTGRTSNRLTLDDQDSVAESLGFDSGQQLMKAISLASRRIAWNSDEAWRRWRLAQRSAAAPGRDGTVAISDRLLIERGSLQLASGVDPAADPSVILELAVESAERSVPISRPLLAQLGQAQEGDSPLQMSGHWTAASRDLFARLFLAGPAALPVIEDLDMYGLMVALLPEWEVVRSLPQRNVLHTFTVDRHLCEAAVNASELAHKVDRPDLLVVGALFHDIGKGRPGDHTEVGMELIAQIGDRMNYSEEDTSVLVDLCRHHLLLSDVAVRRDLDDDGTIRTVAAAVDNVEFLYLLAGLTEADSKATGPAVWGSWKERLLGQLVERTSALLEGRAPQQQPTEWPTAEVASRMAGTERWISTEGDRITVVSDNQPGVFSRVAAVLAMSGLDVISAEAATTKTMAASSFLVTSNGDNRINWEPVVGVLDRALDGRLAIAARVAGRSAEMNRYRRRLSASPPRMSLRADNEISAAATVIDVHAPDSFGILYSITRAMADLRLDIAKATVQTLGPQAVDSFYVTDSFGAKLSDEMVKELEMAVLHAVRVSSGLETVGS